MQIQTSKTTSTRQTKASVRRRVRCEIDEPTVGCRTHVPILNNLLLTIKPSYRLRYTDIIINDTCSHLKVNNDHILE